MSFYYLHNSEILHIQLKKNVGLTESAQKPKFSAKLTIRDEFLLIHEKGLYDFFGRSFILEIMEN